MKIEISGRFTVQNLKRRQAIKSWCGQPVNDESGCAKGINPESQRNM